MKGTGFIKLLPSSGYKPTDSNDILKTDKCSRELNNQDQGKCIPIIEGDINCDWKRMFSLHEKMKNFWW